MLLFAALTTSGQAAASEHYSLRVVRSDKVPLWTANETRPVQECQVLVKRRFSSLIRFNELQTNLNDLKLVAAAEQVCLDAKGMNVLRVEVTSLGR